MNKRWIKIPNYSKYYINTKGDIRNENGYLLKPYKNHNGYLKVTLIDDFGKVKHERVNRLVAQTFIDKNSFKYLPYETIDKIDYDKLQVNHKDENKNNNSYFNLEWCTNDYNANYNKNKRYDKIVKKDKFGKFLKEYTYYGEIFIDLGFDLYLLNTKEKKDIRKRINNCVLGKQKTAYGFVWEKL